MGLLRVEEVSWSAWEADTVGRRSSYFLVPKEANILKIHTKRRGREVVSIGAGHVD